MTLTLADYRAGIDYYSRDLDRQSPEVQQREAEFPMLAQRYADRNPPHFTRSDLELIIKWKYTDARWCKKALTGLTLVSDSLIQESTSTFATLDHPADATQALNRKIRGVGIAGISAIMAAALPHKFPVIDVFALFAIEHYESPQWILALNRNKDGRREPDMPSYVPYTRFCRDAATLLSEESGELWTPRRVDMSLWGLGKDLS